MPLKDLPPDARPREKLLARGAAALADAELLALLLRTGLPGQSVLQMAQALLSRYGGFTGLLTATDIDMKGLGPAKRAELLAVLEIARRAMSEQLAAKPVMESPEIMRNALQLHLAHKPYEVFAAMFLNARKELVAFEELFRGTLAETSVYPREVVLRALHHGAAAVVLAHNHPSGGVKPSRADEAITQRLSAALALVDVRVLDHCIVAPGQFASMLELGLL